MQLLTQISRAIQLALSAALLLVFVWLLPAPAQAQTDRPETLQETLQANFSAAFCRNDWNQALTVLQQIIGSEDTAAQSRPPLIALRYQLEDYRARNARFDQSSSSACAAAIAAADQPAPAPTQTFDWDQALQAFVNRPVERARPSASGCSDPSTLSAEGRCLPNPTARARHDRSWGLGDRPAGEALN